MDHVADREETGLSADENEIIALRHRVRELELEGHVLAKLAAANTERQAHWDPESRITLSYRGNELAGETGEACNVMKKLERERLGIRGKRETKEHLAEELADVIICCSLIGIAEKIDLWPAVVAKFNKTSIENELTTRLIE